MEQTLTPHQALTRAVNVIGGQSAMGRLCGVAQATVWKWLERMRELPAEHVLAVEAATRVSRHDLRPDIYPRGLQDGVPFIPAATVSGEPDLVAENGDVAFQGKDVA